MTTKDKIKRIIVKINIFNFCRKKIMRSRLKNTTPTLLCPNCMGGILFHDLGLQFRSPTVNTMIYQTDFVKFVTNLDHYLSKELVFFKSKDYSFPCATLDDIVIHFTHYHSEEEARTKWTERSKRINKENLFIVCSERDNITKDEILSLKSVEARGILVFTSNYYQDIPYALQLKKYEQDGEIGNILKINHLTGHHEYEYFFDFVKWFNEADGKNHDVRPFAKHL